VASNRRLVAIMFTDMVGYTAATQANEAATLALRKEQEDLIGPLLAAHQGRAVKSTGDGFLVEFESALKATECAVSIQRRLHERNGRSGVIPIQLRIGIHLGDVEQQGSDIFGDAVNIASRIEPVAEPGGICLSGAVREQVRNKIPDKLEKLPPTALKGLELPMEIYRVVLPWTVRAPASPNGGPTGLAVLPFTNMSPDPADTYFADGLTEELITVLSQLRELRVIARTSVMQYKSTPKSVSQIGTELGVSSVLEGSVRRSGNRLRITAQLIDAGTQGHVWAKSYDRELDDVFAVQTEIAKQVTEALKIELRAAEEIRLEARPPVRRDSYLAYLKGRSLQHNPHRAPLEAARAQFELAISLDPNNAAAHAGLATAIRKLGIWFEHTTQADWTEGARPLVARAIELDPNLAEAHYALAMIHYRDREVEATGKELKLALALDPSNAEAHWAYGQLLGGRGRFDEALLEFSLAEAADPLWIQNLWLYSSALIWLGRLDEALVKIRRMGQVAPDDAFYHTAFADYYLARSDLPSCLQELERAEALSVEPRFQAMDRARFYVLSGEREKARTLLRQEGARHPFGQIPVTIATVYGELGDVDDCFQWLETAFQSHNLPVFQLRANPAFEKIRRDPRFQTLLQKMHLT
jgi:adenylate cyclase